MAKFKPAQNFSVSGKHHIESFGDYDVWEKRTTPTVDGVTLEQVSTYLVTQKVKKPSLAFNGAYTTNVEVSEEFDNPTQALEKATKLSK